MMNKSVYPECNVSCEKDFGIIVNTPSVTFNFGDGNKFLSMDVGIKLNRGHKYKAEYDGRNNVWVVENDDILIKIDPKTFEKMFVFLEKP